MDSNRGLQVLTQLIEHRVQCTTMRKGMDSLLKQLGEVEINDDAAGPAILKSTIALAKTLRKSVEINGDLLDIVKELLQAIVAGSTDKSLFEGIFGKTFLDR